MPILTLADARRRNLLELLQKQATELDWSVRTHNSLENAGIQFLYQLIEKNEGSMLKSRNFGTRSINEIKELLREFGLQLDTIMTKQLKLTIGVTPSPTDPEDDTPVVCVEIPLDAEWRVKDDDELIGPIRHALANEYGRLVARAKIYEDALNAVHGKFADDVNTSTDPEVIKAIILGKALMNR